MPILGSQLILQAISSTVFDSFSLIPRIYRGLLEPSTINSTPLNFPFRYSCISPYLSTQWPTDIIPLAKKLDDCKVFGVSSDEYLNYAISNRREWEHRGQEVVASMVEKVTQDTTLE